LIKGLISIIIPSYNYGFLLAQTLKSIEKQSYNNWETIIIDNGSTDNTKEIVEQFTKKDSRFKLLTEKKKGVSKARNKGLQTANGEFIQFLDADDLISENKLKLQIEYLEKHTYLDILSCDTYYFKNDDMNIRYSSFELDDNIVSPEFDEDIYNTIYSLIERNTPICGPVFRARILADVHGFSNDMNYGEDWDFWLKLAFKGYLYGYLKNDLVYSLIRVHNNNTSHEKFKMHESVCVIRKTIKELINENKNLSKRQKKILLKKNKHLETNNFKELFFRNLNNRQNLLILLKHSGIINFIKFIIKALNRKRLQK